MKSIIKSLSGLLLALIIAVTTFQGTASAQTTCSRGTNTLLPGGSCSFGTSGINELIVSARNTQPLYPITLTFTNLNGTCGRVLTLNQQQSEYSFLCAPAQNGVNVTVAGQSPATVNFFQASR